MITGENGTGKGSGGAGAARGIGPVGEAADHGEYRGPAGGHFESELFGHVKGAFTDARADRNGRFELADGRHAVLDEIANITPAQQAKLLRVLETGEFERVGSSKTHAWMCGSSRPPTRTWGPRWRRADSAKICCSG